jgi:hypothetical protein
MPPEEMEVARQISTGRATPGTTAGLFDRRDIWDQSQEFGLQCKPDLAGFLALAKPGSKQVAGQSAAGFGFLLCHPFR